MAAPAIPQNVYITQGDGKVYLQWSIVAGATTYPIQRSIDGVTYTALAAPAINEYLDASGTVGQNYYYQVASDNGATSAYSPPQTVVPTLGGEMSLGELSTRARQRADRLNSNFVTVPEVNSYIQQSQFELYDLLINTYEDYYKAPDAIFYTNGSSQTYPMPNGVLQFKDSSGADFTAQPIYKLLGVDLGLNTNSNGWVTLDKYNYIDRNRYFYPNTASTIYGVFNCRYRWMGANIEFIPLPSSNQPIRLHYIPRLPVLLSPSDITTTSISGWLEYVIVDVAIKILQKEESDVSTLQAQKMALIQRIQSAASNRDAGQPDTISDTRGTGLMGGNGNNGSFGGW